MIIDNVKLGYFKKNGFVLLKDFFDKKSIQEILEDAKLVFIKQMIAKGYVKQEEIKDEVFNEALFKLFKEDFECLSNCGKQVQHLISLHKLSLDTKIVSLLRDLGMEFPNISTRPVLYFNHPKLAKKKVYHTVEAHQDWRSMQGSLNSIVIWIPLVDINKSLGALKLLAGSHLEGLRTKEVENGFGMVQLNKDEINKMQSIEVSVGDILVFSSFLIHESGTNILNKPRWSCHFRYNDLNENTFIERKYAHPYIYKPVENLITKNFPLKKDINKIY